MRGAALYAVRLTTYSALALHLLLGSMASAAHGQDFGRVQPPRDTPGQTDPSNTEATAISGRVVASQSGDGLHRVRVVAGNSTGRRYAAQTDQSGRYRLSGVSPGRYTLTVSKPGFITLAYGQRRPRQPSTPIDVAAGQHLRQIDVRLPSGSVITGRVVDENVAALPLVTVRVLRYVYRQGRQQLVLVGTDRTDDRGQYRVFGLEPGDYYVSATVPRQLLDPAADIRMGRFGQGPGRRFAPATAGVTEDRQGSPVGYAPTYHPGVTNLAEAARVAVGLSAEVGGVDFAVRLVPTATVSGTAVGPDGAPAAGVQVMLVPDGGVTSPDAILGARVQRGGEFEIRNVPPGQYPPSSQPEITRSPRDLW